MLLLQMTALDAVAVATATAFKTMCHKILRVLLGYGNLTSPLKTEMHLYIHIWNIFVLLLRVFLCLVFFFFILDKKEQTENTIYYRCWLGAYAELQCEYLSKTKKNKNSRGNEKMEKRIKNNSISHMEFMIFYVNCGTRLEYYMRSHRSQLDFTIYTIEYKNTRIQ